MIDILMASYNGEKFIAQQIDSILAQSFSDYKLIICDDCSKDSTAEILSDYEKNFPDKISVHYNAAPTGSAQANFMNMLKLSTADYIMFSDQDDFWEKDKIKLTLEKITDMEKAYGNIPLLVHTELAIADENLNITHAKFTSYQGLNPKACTINRLVCQNNVTGCTTMINKALLDIVSGAEAENMLMHDWWFALAAASFGKIGFVDTPTIRYRQHGANQVGAVNNRSIKGAAHIIRERMKTKKRVSITYKQAQNFYEYYKDILPANIRRCLEIYISIPLQPKLRRIAMLLKYKYLKQNFMTAAGQLVFC